MSARLPGDRFRMTLAGLFLLVQTVLIHDGLSGLGRYSDELHHYRQIRRFCEGDFTPDPRITTIPSYHMASVLVAWATGDCSLERMRLVNVAIGLLSAAFFFAACRAGGSEEKVARTFQYYFLPILLPYHFLVYADSISLLANLVTLMLVFQRRFGAAGLAGALAILFRQTNVLWLVFVCLAAALDDDAWRRAENPLRAYLRRVWPALAGLFGFTVFVLWNGGVAVGGRGAFAAGLYTGNVFLFLALYFVLFLPANLAAIWRSPHRLSEPALLGLLFGSYLLFLGTFRVEHPFNKFEGFLRNEMLSLVVSSVFAKGAFFLFAAGGIVSLYLTRLPRPSLYALFPLILLSMVPLRLIEHRYGLTGCVLLLLCRRDESPVVEALGAALAMFLSAVVLYGISQGRFML